MIFEINNTNKKVQDGYAIAGEILAGQEIIDRLQDIVRFTYTKATSGEVISTLLAHQEGIISGLMPKIPVYQNFINDSAIARTHTDRRGIWVNDKFVKSTKLLDYVGNGAHEFSHSPLGYGHGSNWLPNGGWWSRRMMNAHLEFADKNKSVPLVIEKLVEQIAKDKKFI